MKLEKINTSKYPNDPTADTWDEVFRKINLFIDYINNQIDET